MGADPTNVELYQGADQALSLLGRGGRERIAALRRCPETPLPSTLVYKLALGAREAGRFAEASRSSPAASSRARSSARTCGRSTSR